MAKVTLDTIASGYDLSKINTNFATLATALENTVSRDGTVPNTMSANLDMNGKRIINQLASSGEGFVWQGPWVTATEYGLNNLISANGNTYICTEAHTSGSFAADLAALKWELIAAQGASGAGSGDVIASNNLSDLTSASAARANLALVIGTDVQAYNAALANLAGITGIQGDILYFNGSNWVALGTGTAGQVLSAQGAGADPHWVTPATPMFSKSFVSTAQTISSGGVLTLPHAMSATPKITNYYVKCLTAEAGFSIGDMVEVSSAGNTFVGAGSSVLGGFISVRDATNIEIYFSSGVTNPIAVFNKSTKALTSLTNANWSFHVEAYA